MSDELGTLSLTGYGRVSDPTEVCEVGMGLASQCRCRPALARDTRTQRARTHTRRNAHTSGSIGPRLAVPLYHYPYHKWLLIGLSGFVAVNTTRPGFPHVLQKYGNRPAASTYALHNNGATSGASTQSGVTDTWCPLIVVNRASVQ